jgi:hypothetical protein
VKGSKRLLPKDPIPRTNLIAKLDGDFSELSQRELSTSTPYFTRPVTKALVIPQTPENNDSGICDKFASSNDSSDTFLHPSVLASWKQATTPVKRRASFPLCCKHPPDCYDFVCGSYESEIASLAQPSTLYFEESCESDAHSQASADSAVDLSFSSCENPPKLSAESDFFDFEVSSRTDVPHDFQEPQTAQSDATIEAFEEVLKLFSPAQPDCLIGRKMGLSQVDIVTELHNRAMLTILEDIFSVLSDEDLCSVAAVSSSWRQVLKDCKNAHKRKSKHVKLMSAKHKELKVSNAIIQ